MSAHQSSVRLATCLLETKQRWETRIHEDTYILLKQYIIFFHVIWAYSLLITCFCAKYLHIYRKDFSNFVCFSSAVGRGFTVSPAGLPFSWQTACASAQRSQPQDEHQLWVCSHHICLMAKKTEEEPCFFFFYLSLNAAFCMQRYAIFRWPVYFYL